jgi:hypothetical protein
MNQKTSTYKALSVGTYATGLLFAIQKFLRWVFIAIAVIQKKPLSLKKQTRFTLPFAVETWQIYFNHSKTNTNTSLFGVTSKGQRIVGY